MTARCRSAAVLGACLLAVPAGAAPIDNMIEVCADEDRSAAEALKFCNNALRHKAMRKQPDSVRAKVLMNAGIAAYNLRRYGEAADNQTRALEIDPTLGPAYASRAQSYVKTGRLAEAAADYDQAVRYAPRDANAWLGRGVLRLRTGDVRGAVADFDKAVSLAPEWGSAYYNRGVALSQLGEHARAEADFGRVLAEAPEDAEALMRRGRARMALGRRDAVRDFDRAISLRPEWGPGWAARGEFYDRMGRREEANADYMRAYQLGYSDPRLIERMRQIGGG